MWSFTFVWDGQRQLRYWRVPHTCLSVVITGKWLLWVMRSHLSEGERLDYVQINTMVVAVQSWAQSNELWTLSCGSSGYKCSGHTVTPSIMWTSGRLLAPFWWPGAPQGDVCLRWCLPARCLLAVPFHSLAEPRWARRAGGRSERKGLKDKMKAENGCMHAAYVCSHQVWMSRCTRSPCQQSRVCLRKEILWFKMFLLLFIFTKFINRYYQNNTYNAYFKKTHIITEVCI